MPGVPPGVGDRCGGRGPNPFRRVTSQSSASWTRSIERTAGDRAVSWLCLRAVLVAEVDERRLVQVYHLRRAASLSRIRLGLATCVTHGGERTLEAGPAVETSWPRW